MTVYDLIEKFGGEIALNVASVRVGDEYIVVGRLNGDMLEMTEEGRKLANGERDAEIAAAVADAGDTEPTGAGRRRKQ